MERFGEFDSIIIINGHRSRLEHQGCSEEDWRKDRSQCGPIDDFYVGATSTNSDEEHWDHGTYTAAGPQTYCVSYRHLAHYTCITCNMTDKGKVEGCGERFVIEK